MLGGQLPTLTTLTTLSERPHFANGFGPFVTSSGKSENIEGYVTHPSVVLIASAFNHKLIAAYNIICSVRKLTNLRNPG